MSRGPTTPFHRFGVNIKTKEETKRDRRTGLQEEQALLAARSKPAVVKGEMLRIQNRHVDWEQHQIAIPGKHAKDGENRRIPFDPHGRLAPILKAARP